MGHSTGLVLAGGGVKSVAHVALFQQLESLNISIETISGASAGALIGAMYASGLSHADILDFFKNTSLFKPSLLAGRRPGIFHTDKYLKIIQDLLPPTFEDLDIPLIVAAVNMQKGCVEYFDHGDLYKPLLASVAVPLIFSPVEIGEYMYADAGIMNNFPIEPVQDKCTQIIGSFLSTPQELSKKELNNALKMSNRANSLLIHAANQYKLDKTDCTIEFPLAHFGLFDTKKVDEIYITAREYLSQISNDLKYKLGENMPSR